MFLSARGSEHIRSPVPNSLSGSCIPRVRQACRIAVRDRLGRAGRFGLRREDQSLASAWWCRGMAGSKHTLHLSRIVAVTCGSDCLA